MAAKMNSDQQQENTTGHNSDNLNKLRFRNYIPRTEELKKYCEEADEPDTTLQQIIASQSEMLREANRKFGDPALDLDNMVPRKGNWDMKRSLSMKLTRLEHRTRRAIIDIVRQKQQDSGRVRRTNDDRQSVSSDELE